jgi:hypothetical protein
VSWNAAEHGLSDVEPAHGVDDPGERVGDVVEVPREDADLLTAPVDLDADPVELPLHRRPVEARDRSGHALGRGGEHREHRPEDLEPHRAETLLPVAERDLRRPREVAGKHERAAGDVSGDPGRPGDRVHHEAGERPLPELPGEETSDEAGLQLGCAGGELAQDPPPHRPGPGTLRGLDFGDRTVEVVDGQRGLGRRLELETSNRRVADADSSLAWDAGEEPDGDRHLPGIERPQKLCEDRDLPGARARARDVFRGGDELGQESHRVLILPPRADRRDRYAKRG